MLNSMMVKPLLPGSYSSLNRNISDLTKVKHEWVIYCVNCKDILATSPKEQCPDNIRCEKCSLDVSSDVRKRVGVHHHISTRPQVEGYMRRGHLPRLINSYRDFQHLIPRGEAQRKVLNNGDIPIIIASDAAKAANWRNQQFYPVVIQFDCIPPRYQRHFAILTSYHCGDRANQPPTEVLYKLVLRDLAEILENKIEWQDPAKPLGTLSRSALIITQVQADLPEVGKLLNQAVGGYDSCIYCLIHGEYYNGAVRLTDLVHERPHDLRTAQHRMECARKLALEALKEERRVNPFAAEEDDPDFDVPMEEDDEDDGDVPRGVKSIHGIKNYPILFGMPHFDETFAHASDLLHVVYLGVVKDMVKEILTGYGAPWNLRKDAQDTDFKG
jgi:hypothetical protein